MMMMMMRVMMMMMTMRRRRVMIMMGGIGRYQKGYGQQISKRIVSASLYQKARGPLSTMIRYVHTPNIMDFGIRLNFLQVP